MKVEINYLGTKYVVELDITITTITIQSDQLAEVDFLIRIPTSQFDSTLSFLSKVQSYQDSDTITLNDVKFVSDNIFKFFDSHFIRTLIETTVTNGSRNFSDNPMRSFELLESLDRKSLKLSDNNAKYHKVKDLQIEAKLKIQRGNRFNQVYKSNIPFINFVHFCLKEFLNDKDYQLAALPSQYVTRYQTTQATLFEASFLDSLQQRCKYYGVTLTVSQFYKPELEDSLINILSSFSQLLGKEFVLATKEELKQSAQPVEGVVVPQLTSQAAEQQFLATIQSMQPVLVHATQSLQAVQATSDSLLTARAAPDFAGGLDLTGKSTSPLVAAVQRDGVASTRATANTDRTVKTNDQYQHFIPFSPSKPQ